MNKSIKFAVAAAILGSLTACGGSSESSSTSVDNVAATKLQITNTVLKPWEGPFQGVPAFDSVKLEDLQPAFETAMAAHLVEIDEILNNEAAPTFDNTIVALEAVGADLDRVWTYYGIWRSNMSSPEVREVGKVLSPLISKHYSKISQNEKLFARIKAVYESEEMKTLRKDQQRLVENSYKGLVRSGALLSGEDKARYAAINLELAELHRKFGNNVLADEENYVTYLTKDQLGGLPASVVTAAASAAKDLGKEGQYAITNTRSSMDPFLTYSTERELRKEVWNKYYSRGDNGDEFDNNAIIAKILKLRHERVNLLGYANYAEWRLEDLSLIHI